MMNGPKPPVTQPVSPMSRPHAGPHVVPTRNLLPQAASWCQAHGQRQGCSTAWRPPALCPWAAVWKVVPLPPTEQTSQSQDTWPHMAEPGPFQMVLKKLHRGSSISASPLLPLEDHCAISPYNRWGESATGHLLSSVTCARAPRPSRGFQRGFSPRVCLLRAPWHGCPSRALDGEPSP